MKIASISTRRISLPFATPMVTSNATYENRTILMVRVESTDGAIGWGECSALEDPNYFWETVDVAEESINAQAAPSLIGRNTLAKEVAAEVVNAAMVGPMTAAAIELAMFDAQLRYDGISLKSYLGVEKDSVSASAVLGIPPDRQVSTLLNQVQSRAAKGIRNFKLKIEPGWDVEPVAAIREQVPRQFGLIVDANESFAGKDLGRLRDLSDLDVMIEQPLARNDFAGHAALVESGIGRICLDESVESLGDARRACSMGAAHVLCVKPGRLGGIISTLAVLAECESLGIDIRVGGMYSSAKFGSVERVLAAGHSQSDIMPFGLRWKGGVDLAQMDQVDASDGTVQVPDGVGVGPPLTSELLDRFAQPAEFAS